MEQNIFLRKELVMKKLLITMCLVLIMSAGVQGQDANDVNDNGFVLSLFSMENSEPEYGNTYLRLGYRYGVMEAYAGGEAEEGNYLEYGFLLHSRDIVEPNAVSIISPALTGIFNTDVVMTGYTGIHWVTEQRAEELRERYSGAIVGIDIKGSEDSPLSLRSEIHYENNLSNDIVFFAGLCWKF